MRRTGLHLFEGGGILEQAYQYLLSTPPTSIEAERGFSAATQCNEYIGKKIKFPLRYSYLHVIDMLIPKKLIFNIK